MDRTLRARPGRRGPRPGGEIRERTEVTDVRDAATGAVVRTGDGQDRRFDAVVLATGAWLGRHARKFGVRSVVQAGRGTASASRSSTCRPAPCTSPASASPAPRSVTGCASPE
ncbi:FAD-dependent oxidoreductase [Streptomyces sp. INA 01156]